MYGGGVAFVKIWYTKGVPFKIGITKGWNGLALEYLSNLFSNRDRVTSYSLRDTESKLAIPKPHTNYIKNSFG